ncbi:MAG: OsmC family protein [Promethearchaeota archaeon]|nr:MAG: OsmC family protein [Candidatus Lokiarchaeota archaeon]
MLTESKSEVGIKLEEEMIFKCDLGKIQMTDLFIDEQHKKSTDKIGPNPAKLLALSVLGCLAASFAFCLQKTNFSLSDLDGKAVIISKRNEKGFWRLQKLDIKLNPKIDNPEMRKRANQCIKFFEQYCIISESVRNGIDIDVKIEY